jgi:hypothetical protein
MKMLLFLLLAQIPEPTWSDYPPVQSGLNEKELGAVLLDIESHCPNPYIVGGRVLNYRDSNKVTWAHETTHGVNAWCRLKHNGWNAYYCLNNKVAFVKEQPVTIDQIAYNVPPSMRRHIFKSYLLGTQRDQWNSRSTYLLDEWSAYTNGVEVALELNHETGAGECKYMLEFTAIALTYATYFRDPDPQLTNYIGWNTNRCIELYRRARNNPKMNPKDLDETWNAFVKNDDCKFIQERCYKIYGAKWTYDTFKTLCCN